MLCPSSCIHKCHKPCFNQRFFLRSFSQDFQLILSLFWTIRKFDLIWGSDACCTLASMASSLPSFCFGMRNHCWIASFNSIISFECLASKMRNHSQGIRFLFLSFASHQHSLQSVILLEETRKSCLSRCMFLWVSVSFPFRFCFSYSSDLELRNDPGQI